MHVDSQSYYVLGAQDAVGGMRYLLGPVAIGDDAMSAQPFLTVELARAALKIAAQLRPHLAWSILKADAEIRLAVVESAA